MKNVITLPTSILFLVMINSFNVNANTFKYLQLIDKLDRPQDGYCFDVQGVVGHFRADKPLVAHNCKQGAAPDGLMEHNKNSMLVFPAFGLCVTAMGTANTVLPNTSLMLKKCKEEGLFASSLIQKQFTFNNNQQLTLNGSKLCVRVGDDSAHTFSSIDRWRVLFLADCKTTPLKYSQWQLVTP